jgi:hypothetical protein
MQPSGVQPPGPEDWIVGEAFRARQQCEEPERRSIPPEKASKCNSPARLWGSMVA